MESLIYALEILKFGSNNFLFIRPYFIVSKHIVSVRKHDELCKRYFFCMDLYNIVIYSEDKHLLVINNLNRICVPLL